MIKVTYKEIWKPDDVFTNADKYQVVEGVPMRKPGLYIYEGDEQIAFINELASIRKVEKI